MGATAATNDWVARVLGVDLSGIVDTEADGLGSDESYRPYLLKAARQLLSKGSAGFGLVVGKSREQHRLMLHPSKPPRSLAGSLARETGLRAMAWGTVQPAPDQPGVMQLTVEGPALPGLKTKAEQMLRHHKPLPFKKVRLMMDGSEVGEVGDTEYGDVSDRPVSVLPVAPAVLGEQGQTLVEAAQSASALCEECEAVAEEPEAAAAPA